MTVVAACIRRATNELSFRIWNIENWYFISNQPKVQFEISTENIYIYRKIHEHFHAFKWTVYRVNVTKAHLQQRRKNRLIATIECSGENVMNRKTRFPFNSRSGHFHHLHIIDEANLHFQRRSITPREHTYTNIR